MGVRQTDRLFTISVNMPFGLPGTMNKQVPALRKRFAFSRYGHDWSLCLNKWWFLFLVPRGSCSTSQNTVSWNGLVPVHRC